jgi:hypothetical protein
MHDAGHTHLWWNYKWLWLLLLLVLTKWHHSFAAAWSRSAWICQILIFDGYSRFWLGCKASNNELLHGDVLESSADAVRHVPQAIHTTGIAVILHCHSNCLWDL